MINKTHDFNYYDNLYKEEFKKGYECFTNQNVWTALSWMEDESFEPWNPNAINMLNELKQLDSRLYDMIMAGLSQLGELAKGLS